MIEKKFTVASFDVYPNSTIKPVALQRYMQQFAREDCDGMGCTYNDMREWNMVFVMTKMGIRVNRPIFAYDELTVKTYNNRVSGITYEREFEFYKDGIEVIHATTQWVIVKYDTRQLVRPRNFPFPIPEHNFDCATIDLPRVISVEGGLNVGERTVRLSDLDENNHLNNCVYSDITMDILPYNRETDYVKEIKIIFRHEALMGEALSLNLLENDGVFAVSAYNNTSNQPCFEAECILDKISG